MDTAKKTLRWLPLVLILVALVALLAWTPAAATVDAPAHSDTIAVDAVPTAPAVEAAPVPTETPVVVDSRSEAEKRHEQLRAYVLDRMNGWTHASAQMPVASYDDIADDIATAVLSEATDSPGCSLLPSNDGQRRCLWTPGWNTDHAKATLLAGLAYWEGARYAKYVDELLCDNLAWREDRANAALIHLGGNCDNGRAHSLWQIHPIVDRASPLYGLCNTERVDGSRLGAATCALAIARSSIQGTGDLSGYTGEPPFEGGHPKADKRLDFVRLAVAKHPWAPLQPE
jgi:hypothetical protein